ncbi:lysine exporter LysO family protein [Deferribacter abyssi]|uniref:lysine exporter LysO family protein n=1 Tax=Deferribacter abyssi TaxID=213806 RepID=UPI003C278088
MILSVTAGILMAQFGFLPTFLMVYSDRITDYALYFLLFLIGYGIGRDKESLVKLFTADKYAFLVPVGTVIGTLFGGYIASFFLKLTIKDSLAISAGFGWYSLSAVIITKLKSADLGSIAFLSNVIRELISIILVPFLAKYAGPYISIAPGGATTMDTTLPIIEKYAGESAAVVAFINGFILSTLVPIIVPFILKF